MTLAEKNQTRTKRPFIWADKYIFLWNSLCVYNTCESLYMGNTCEYFILFKMLINFDNKFITI